MKYCCKCDQTKDFSEFSKNKRNKDGLQSWCKLCMAIEREKWFSANPERRKELNRQWQQDNADKVRAKSVAWRSRNLERARRNSLEWKRKNPAKNARNQQRRRAIQAGVNQGYFPTVDELVALYGPKCMYPECLGTDLTVDHVVPLSLGGDHDIGNAQLLCRLHNSQKGNRNSNDYRPKET